MHEDGRHTQELASIFRCS